MNGKNVVLLTLFVCVSLGFAWGLYRLFMIPLETGTAYTPYSTYRADPLGMRVLYEALARHEPLQVTRNETNVLHIGPGEDRTLLFAGVADSPDPVAVVDALDAFAHSGGRIVVAYQGSGDALPDWMVSDEEDEAQDAGEGEGEAEGDGEAEEETDTKEAADEEELVEEMEESGFTNVTYRWGYRLGLEKLVEDEEGREAAWVMREEGPASLPEEVLWRSAYVLEELDPAWKSIYERDGHPVLIERALGEGSVVVATDAYFLSNEAMLDHRYPALLSWMLGESTHIIFDETHLGISRDPGIVRLMRKYRLTPLLVSLAVLALLFVWKNASSLVPRRPGTPGVAQEAELGQSAAAGLSNLLRRSVPREGLLSVCHETWRQDCGRQARTSVDTAAQAVLNREAAPAAEEVVKHYNEIAGLLHERDRL